MEAKHDKKLPRLALTDTVAIICQLIEYYNHSKQVSLNLIEVTGKQRADSALIQVTDWPHLSGVALVGAGRGAAH